MSIYHGADEAILLYAPEPGSAAGTVMVDMPTFANAGDLTGTAPGSPVVLGYVNVPAIKHTRNNAKGYKIGRAHV